MYLIFQRKDGDILFKVLDTDAEVALFFTDMTASHYSRMLGQDFADIGSGALQQELNALAEGEAIGIKIQSKVIKMEVLA